MKILKHKTVYTIIRILLGFLLVFSGLNTIFQFAPLPPFPEPATMFLEALFATGYMMVVVGIVKTVVGTLLVSNRYVPLAATLLAPLSFNFVLFHAFLDFKGILPALVIALLNIYLILYYFDRFKPLLQK